MIGHREISTAWAMLLPLLAAVLLASLIATADAESSPLEEIDVLEEAGLSPSVALQTPHVAYDLYAGMLPVYHLDAPDKVFRVSTEQTERFVAAVDKNKGFTFAANIQPAHRDGKGILLSVDEPLSYRPAYLRICYDGRMRKFLMEYSIKGNNVMTWFREVHLSTERMNRIVLVVHHLNVTLYVNCRLAGTAKLQGPIYETPLSKRAEFRLGRTTAKIWSQPPYKGAIQEMKFLFTDMSPQVLGGSCSTEEKTEYLKGLVSMNGCTDCPFVSQLVDVFQAMSVHLDDLKLRLQLRVRTGPASKDGPTATEEGSCRDSMGYFYYHSETWAPSPCRNCSCYRGNITCLDTPCPKMDCDLPYQLPGQCCPSCLSALREPLPDPLVDQNNPINNRPDVAVTWSDWGPWGVCSKSCGGGNQKRMRNCNKITGHPGGHDCQGQMYQTRDCNTYHCPIDGGWSNWTEWSLCSVSCEVGSQVRTRVCDNPAPAYDGVDCIGDNSETRNCVLLEKCPTPCSPNPCFQGVVSCTEQGVNFHCGLCPVGYAGDGIRCHDINECKLVRTACNALASCKNKKPGYLCTPCPAGYQGDRLKGIGLEDARSKRQVCEDIDECAKSNGGCRHSPCINTVGSYQCGPCDPGYSREGRADGQCILVNVCPLGWHNCTGNFKCQPAGNLSFVCVCPEIGHFFRDGMCIKDTDLDGYPDAAIDGCVEKWCKKDNCPALPNSGQEDHDDDGLGDACDDDDDNDGIKDHKDNCALLPNVKQVDSDGDGVGNLCDNCIRKRNPYQEDFDHDGLGNACDPDPDQDGIFTGTDNCPLARNEEQEDFDYDRVGDNCDNCPYMANTGQSDKDFDMVGDVCDTDIDRDGDGIQDDLDICPYQRNADQANHDTDSSGDLCDTDDDDDGFPDVQDNCPLVKNPKQEDVNGNGIGDACENDYDGDSFANDIDVCPHNREIDRVDFMMFQRVPLHHRKAPRWRGQADGTEIVQERVSCAGLAVGYHKFSNVDFNGTFFVNTDSHDDYFGFVFSYQSNKRFYVVMWKKSKEDHSSSSTALPGVQIKVVNSATGPSTALERALWHTGSTPRQVRLLWHDPKQTPWRSYTAYRWMLTHDADSSRMRLRVYDGGEEIIDTGYLYDRTLRGGRLGFFVLSQPQVIWSDLSYRCRD